MKVSKPSPIGHGFHESVNQSMNSSLLIERNDIIIPTSSTVFSYTARSWMEFALHQHEIDVKAINAECRLTRMTIYPPGSHYVRHHNVAQESGGTYF